MMSDFIPQETPFTGRKMLLIIVAFFGVIIAVNGTMLTFAVKTFGGLVVSNSYVASQRFNEDIAAAKAQPIRKWSFDIETSTNQIALDVQDRDGSRIEGLTLSIKIARPSHERTTLRIPLTEIQPGLYQGDARLKPGQWRGTITSSDGQTRSLTFIHTRQTS